MSAPVLFVGGFDIARGMDAARRHEAPSNHVFAMPDLERLGFEVTTLALTAEERRGGWPMQRRIWRDADRAQLVVASTHYEVRALALLRRAGLFRPRLAAFVHSLPERRIENLWLDGFELLLPWSHDAERRLRALAPRARIAHIPYGADLNFYPPPPPATAARDLVLSVGVSGRDFATLIAAAPQIAAPVHIVGRVGAAEAGQARDRVTLHSSGNYDLSFADLSALYARAACVVIVTHGSNHPYGNTALVEAMAKGCPVVITASTGIDIDPAGAGFGACVPAHDAAALAAAVNRILADPSKAQEMGRAARSAAESQYNTAATARALAQALGSA